MKRILKKYSNNKLCELTGLPVGFISGYRKRIFVDPILKGIGRNILTNVKKYEAQIG